MGRETGEGHATKTVSSFFVKHKNWESLGSTRCLTMSQENKKNHASSSNYEALGDGILRSIIGNLNEILF